MPRGAKGVKPAKAKVEAKCPVARKSGKSEGSRNRQLEERLAEALKFTSEHGAPGGHVQRASASLVQSSERRRACAIVWCGSVSSSLA